MLAFLLIAVYFVDAATTVGSNISTDGTLTVSGATTLNGNVTLGDNSADTVTISGAATIGTPLTLNGSTTFNGTTTISDGKLLDLSAILHDDTAQQGLLLPQRAGGPSANPTTAEGYLAYDSTANSVKLYTGSSWVSVPSTIERSVPLPLGSWSTCGTMLDFISGNDTDPDFSSFNSFDVTSSRGGLVILYDNDPGFIDNAFICNQFFVPANYSSGGSFRVRAQLGSANATQTETIICDVSVNNTDVIAPPIYSVNLANTTTAQTVIVTPTATYTANSHVGIICGQGNSSADDTVRIFGIEWFYIATQ